MTSEQNRTKISEQDLFTLLLEFKDYALILTSANKTIFVWNLGAASLYGYSSKEIIGQSISTLYKEKKSLEQHEFYLGQALKYGKVEFDGWETKKDNTPFHANTIVIAFYHADGSIKSFAKICRDTTRFKKLEQENAILKESLSVSSAYTGSHQPTTCK